jgi:hypothetical protein
MKLPAHRAGLPGDEWFFVIAPLDPACKAGLAGHIPGQHVALLNRFESHPRKLGKKTG